MPENNGWSEYRLYVKESLTELKTELASLKIEFQRLNTNFNVFKAKMLMIGSLAGFGGAVLLQIILHYI